MITYYSFLDSYFGFSVKFNSLFSKLSALVYIDILDWIIVNADTVNSRTDYSISTFKHSKFMNKIKNWSFDCFVKFAWSDCSNNLLSAFFYN